ncbi:Fe-S cluster assembly protein SufB [Rothia sp. LK2588]|uniref:Fe-S cluster assembly protein SufB n=1 Tax=Rothia sp. LK2588 TaxID=3114369 RepID=UPI0034CE19AE
MTDQVERQANANVISEILEANPELEGIGTYEYGWFDSDEAGQAAQRGLSEDVVRDISAKKNEPEWMLNMRLKALKFFDRKPMPTWGADLSEIDFDNIKYFVRSTEGQAKTWEDLPEDIRNTYEKLGIPEAERERLVAGVAAQYESEVVYHQIREDLESQGVIFVDTDTALKEHEDLFREYFGTVIPTGDNKFSALNTAVWSGGSFIYVPKGVHVDIPLQAYFRINTENMGQFERTLIIADEGSYVHYIEGCTAPIYKSDSLHSAVVEIIVKKNARVRYTTIQNWSNNVYNLVTKRTLCEEGATMEWVDGNIGSKVTQKYPAVYMVGEHAKGETLSIAFAGEGQHQDTGSKMVHIAPHTSSSIVSKSIARNGGRSAYRGLVQVREGAHHSKSNVVCDALLVDTISRSDTYPYVDIREDDVTMGHEATVSRVSEEQLFYLMQRGLSEEEAMAMIVRGFVEPIARELPMEYALELNRLIELQMEGSVG